MRLCDIIDIKVAFMEKTDLSEEEIQTIIDDIPTAFDGDKVIEQLEEKDSDCEDFGTCNYCQRYWCPRTLIDRDDAIEIVKAGGMNENN